MLATRPCIVFIISNYFVCTTNYTIIYWPYKTNHAYTCSISMYTCSRLLKITCLFCKRALWKRWYSAQEAYNLKEPTNRSHPIVYWCIHVCVHMLYYFIFILLDTPVSYYMIIASDHILSDVVYTLYISVYTYVIYTYYITRTRIYIRTRTHTVSLSH